MTLNLPYNILIGPLSNSGVLGQYLHSPNIVCFASHYFADTIPEVKITYYPEMTFDQILAQLPADWKPDLVIWWDLVYHGLPIGIADCPYPTAVIVGDWNLSFLTALNYVSAFDCILSDRHFAQRLSESGYEHILFWPGFSFEPDKHLILPETEKIYDISFIGNLSLDVHWERSFYLERIAKLAQQYKIFIGGGVYGEEYTRVFNQSKIVFNYGICQVMNMRAYEATGCGALLFMEDTNHEVREFLPDRECCVLYNSDNLEELLHYYLSHDQERETISRAGHARIQQYSYEKQFEWLLRLVPEAISYFKGVEQRLFHARPALEQTLIMTRQLYTARHHSRKKSIELLSDPEIFHSELARLYTGDYRLLNAMGCFLFTELIESARAEGRGFNVAELKHLEHILVIFQVGIHLKPDHPFLYYHFGLAYEAKQQLEEAVKAYKKGLELVNNLPQDLDLEANFVMPFDYSSFAIEWQKISFKYRTDLAKRRQKYIALMTYQLGQKLAYLNASQEEAFQFCHLALTAYQDIGQVGFILYQLYWARGEREKAIAVLTKRIATHPFSMDLWGKYAEYLYTEQKDQQLIEFCLEYLPVFQVNASLMAQRHTLELYFRLANICLGLKQGTPLAGLVSYLEGQFTPLFYQLLKEITTEFAQPFKYEWNPEFPEILPTLEPELDLLANSEQPDCRIVKTRQAPFSYLRSYAELSDLDVGKIGFDLIPPCFYTSELPSSVEIDNWKKFNFLVICQSLKEPGIIEALQDFLRVFADNSSLTCHIWFPAHAPTEEELEELEQALEIESEATINLLLDNFYPEEQLSLLKKVDCIFGYPSQATQLYLWWGKALGCPTLFLSQPCWVYPGITLELCPPAELKHYYKELYQGVSLWQQNSEADSKTIQAYSKQEAKQIVINTLWLLKLRQKLSKS